ncbi:hypothetical protein [Pseudobacteriovorax antillogorgiicola]|uniref:Uncharacterized protein n=1 Tax=Pseudobacteriovorax antillogorgiicola TaxID=1513793 RepID=A0A1Y6B834_9BACT|nr:hypothetical protein [Pseudobacteriovorax antillogorgiicola]TCS59338.1 hypothetical protein EDD56_101247 [Pseudobacteriovorax antillogorgiicola]SME89199.1 hypothetical protein SAMN06296036_101239 [Pseudobacteriovorax antillogorgiicola]
MDRRSQQRCDVCQGPTKEVDGKIVCRNSLCSFNHEDVPCPRCQSKGPDAIGYDESGKVKYSCKDCLYNWTAA